MLATTILTEDEMLARIENPTTWNPAGMTRPELIEMAHAIHAEIPIGGLTRATRDALVALVDKEGTMPRRLTPQQIEDIQETAGQRWNAYIRRCEEDTDQAIDPLHVIADARASGEGSGRPDLRLIQGGGDQ